jgi:hypothetical protein
MSLCDWHYDGSVGLQRVGVDKFMRNWKLGPDAVTTLQSIRAEATK